MKKELKTQTWMQIFLICILIKQQNTWRQTTLLNDTFYETNFKPKLFTANVECNSTVIKEPKTVLGSEKAILFVNLSSRSMVATSCFGSLSTLLYTSDLKWHWRWKFYQTKYTRYLGIAVATYFFSSSLVLGDLNLQSFICFVKHRVRSELTNS